MKQTIKRPAYKRRAKEENKLGGWNIPIPLTYPPEALANSECTTRQATPEETEWLSKLPSPSKTGQIARMNLGMGRKVKP
jgi:hypothetical protein